MKKTSIFDLDIYSRRAVVESIKIYKKVEGLRIALKEDNNKLTIIFETHNINLNLSEVVLEFSNYVLGLTKEYRTK